MNENIRYIAVISFIVTLLACPIFDEANAGTISLSPAAQGTEHKYMFNYYGEYFPRDVIEYHIKARNNHLWGFPQYDDLSTGLIEFDISSLSSLTPGTFSAELILNGTVYPSHTQQANQLEVFNLAESSENGSLIAGSETTDGLIGNLLTTPIAPGQAFYSIDVTQALVNDLLNLPSNSFSGFLLDWEHTEFHLDSFNTYHFDTPTAYFSTISNPPELRITTNSTPEPSAFLLLGAGLLGLRIISKKYGRLRG